MTNGLIGRKLGMTRVFAEDGTATPVTVIEAGPCQVVQVKTGTVQLGFGAQKAKRANKADLGHAKAAGLEAAPRVIREFDVAGDTAPAAGSTVTVGIFAAGERVKVTGTSKGKGFQGVVKREGFSGGPATHGSKTGRIPGSLGASAWPSRVIKGKRLPGQMGNKQITVRNVVVVGTDVEQNLIWIRGAVPGARNSTVIIREAKSGGK